jgi:hypothetical protein
MSRCCKVLHIQRQKTSPTFQILWPLAPPPHTHTHTKRTAAHTDADKDQCILQNIYFHLEDVEDVKILVKLLPLLQIQQYSLAGHNIKQTKSLLQI